MPNTPNTPSYSAPQLNTATGRTHTVTMRRNNDCNHVAAYHNYAFDVMSSVVDHFNSINCNSTEFMETIQKKRANHKQMAKIYTFMCNR